MIRPLKVFFFFLALIAISVPASALEFDFFYRGIRPLGMGDAFTAVANDENAAFYNPAGLDSVKKGRIEAFPLTVEYASNTPKLINDMNDIDTGDLPATTDTLRKHIGKPQYARVSLFPNYTRHGFEIGVLAQAKFRGEAHQPSFPYVDVEGGADGAGVVAFSKGFDARKGKDRFSIGITGMFVQRKGLSKRYTATDLADKNYDFQNDLNTGSALGFNLGGIYQFKKWPFKPAVGLSIQNVGDMDFGSDVGKVEQTINFGVSITDFIWKFPTTIALDYKDIAGELGNDKDKGKRIYLGAEIDLHKRFTVRAGLNQGYVSFGAEFRFWVIKLAYARYSEEVGAFAGQKDEERNVFLLTIGW